MSNFLSDACVKTGGVEGHKVYARSRNNHGGLKYIVTQGDRILYSCVNNGAGDSLSIHWRYRDDGNLEPVLPSAVVEYVESLVSSQTNETIDHYNAVLEKRHVAKHHWARHLEEEAVVA